MAIIVSIDIGVKNLAVCVVDTNDMSIRDWCILPLADKDAKVKSISLCSIADTLYNQLSNKLVSWKYPFIDYVLIENQPVLKNPTMKSIQMLVYGFFQHERMAQKVGEIRLVAASGKLKVKDVVLCTSYKSSYMNSKKSAVLTTLDYLKNSPSSLELLNGNVKKDDLCDCFLQAVYFRQKHMK